MESPSYVGVHGCASVVFWIEGFVFLTLILMNDTDYSWTLGLRVFDDMIFAGTFNLVWLVVPFPFISAVSEMLQALLAKPAIRWIEFAFSAGVMLWLIAQLSGVQDLLVLIMLVVANAQLQLCGWRIELARRNSTGSRQNKRHMADLMQFAWILHCVIWIPILISFICAVSTDPPPVAIYLIPPTLFGLFTVFGMVQWFWVNERCGLGDFAAYDAAMSISSIVAKTVLAGMVYGGTRSSRDNR